MARDRRRGQGGRPARSEMAGRGDHRRPPPVRAGMSPTRAAPARQSATAMRRASRGRATPRCWATIRRRDRARRRSRARCATIGAPTWPPAPTPRGALPRPSTAAACTWCAAGPRAPRRWCCWRPGSFGFSADWAVVQARLAARGLRSLAYDRAGLGLSEAGPAPRDGLAIAYDLERCWPRRRGGPLSLSATPWPACTSACSPAATASGSRASCWSTRSRPVMAERRAGAAGRRPLPAFRARRAAVATRLACSSPFSRWGDTIGLEGDARASQALGVRRRRATTAPPPRRSPTGRRPSSQALAVGPLDPAWPVAVVTAGGVQPALRSEDRCRRRRPRPPAAAISTTSPAPTTPACSVCASPTRSWRRLNMSLSVRAA